MTRPNESPTAPRDDAALVPEATARERERAAFKAGALWRHRTAFVRGIDMALLANDEAARIYPAPQRPRVARDPFNDSREWQYKDGEIHTRLYRAHCWSIWYPAGSSSRHDDTCPAPTPERVALWADLYVNPTEPSDAPAADAAGRA